MSQAQLKSAALKIKKIGEEVWKNLGCGFQEVNYQGSVAIELRMHKIEYLKEVNIEVFYKGQSVGTDRPDFIITKMEGCKEPIILELKITDKISDAHRIQLSTYCISAPKNNNPILTDFVGGVILAFPQNNVDGKIKVIAVDSKANILIDDQAQEDALAERDKQQEQERKQREKEKGKKEVQKKKK